MCNCRPPVISPSSRRPHTHHDPCGAAAFAHPAPLISVEPLRTRCCPAEPVLCSGIKVVIAEGHDFVVEPPQQVTVPAAIKSRISGDRWEPNLWILESLELFFLYSTLLPTLLCRLLQKNTSNRTACAIPGHICYRPWTHHVVWKQLVLSIFTRVAALGHLCRNVGKSRF